MITPVIILVLLTSPLMLAFVYAKYRDQSLDVAKYASLGLGIAFIYFSIGHMVKTQGMVEMLPPWVPFRLAMVYFTGLLEFIVGLALFIPRYRTFAAKFAIVIFIVFFPANIYAALNSVGLGGHQWGAMYLLIRGPLQLTLIAWAYFLCIKGNSNLMQLTMKAPHHN
jgi:uncharacterized membrane protein